MTMHVHHDDGAEPTVDRAVLRPLVDIFENQDELLLLAELPGVRPDDVHVDLEDSRLTISAHRAPVSRDADTLLSGPHKDLEYRRVFAVPETIDAGRIEARFDAGVLQLTLPRHERTKPRRIAVASG